VRRLPHFDRGRAAEAEPDLSEATYTRLTELDGLELTRFSLFDDRPLVDGGRLRIWRMEW
jgi:hypothetical protein